MKEYILSPIKIKKPQQKNAFCINAGGVLCIYITASAEYITRKHNESEVYHDENESSDL